MLLDLEVSSDLDAPSAGALAEPHEELRQRRVRPLLSRVHRRVRQTLDHSGVTARVGADHIYRRSVAAARDFRTPSGRGPAPEKE